MDLAPDPLLRQKAAAELLAICLEAAAVEARMKVFCAQARAAGLVEEAHDVADAAQMVELARDAANEVLGRLSAA